MPVFNKALEEDDDLKLQAAEALAKVGAALPLKAVPWLGMVDFHAVVRYSK